MMAGYFGMLGTPEFAYIIELLGGPYFATELRTTCRFMREFIQPPVHRTAQRLFDYAAFQGRLDLCELAYSRKRRDFTPGTGIIAAAQGGHKWLCEYIADRWGKNGLNLNLMLYVTASDDRTHECALAIRWGAKPSDLLVRGVHHESERICDAALALGATNREEALSIAARIDSERMCRHLVRDGFDADRLLLDAAYAGNIPLCRLAHELGARNFDGMASWGFLGNCHKTICIELEELAVDWGSANVDQFLYAAACRGDIDACWRARAKGANEYDAMLMHAACNCRYDVCRLALSWGANVRVLDTAADRTGDGMLRNIAAEWTHDQDSADETDVDAEWTYDQDQTNTDTL